MYKTILVPVDIAHLGEAEATIDVASILGGENANIILLNVVEDIPDWAAAELPRGIREKSLQNSLAGLEAIAKSSSVKMKVEARKGHPYKTILEVAEGEGVDLIIIASHKPELQDYFLGSTAAKVVRHARCSVLVIR
ncbi:MAG: universal stress protein [Gammaproteobacteria bacterium]|nr:universal stress protein [Gammaproteobacteria bacterium]